MVIPPLPRPNPTAAASDEKAPDAILASGAALFHWLISIEDSPMFTFVDFSSETLFPRTTMLFSFRDWDATPLIRLHA